MFKKLNSKKAFILGVVLLVFVEAITSTMYVINSKKISKSKIIDDPELARAMTYTQVKAGDEATSSEYVQFDAFFLRDIDGDGNAEGIRGTCKEIGKFDNLYMKVNVLTNGYLKDGEIIINGKNFYLQTAIPKDNEIKDNLIGKNTTSIKFNQINNGTQKTITGYVCSGDSYDSTKAEALNNNINNYSQVNEIVFRGTHVNDLTGEETKIEKKVNLNVDWYGTANAEIATSSLSYDISNYINAETQNLDLKINLQTRETTHELLLKKSYIEGTVPTLNGYEPISVKVNGTNIVSSYDQTTRKFTAYREASLSFDGTITKDAYYGWYRGRSNSYELEIEYSKEAYDSVNGSGIELKIPVKTYYEAFNNQNEEFTNPYISNTAEDIVVASFKNPQGKVALFDITVGRYDFSYLHTYYVPKEKVQDKYNNNYKENATNTTYTVEWTGYTGSEGESSGMTIRESDKAGTILDDKFQNADGTEESINDLTSNIGIYFSGANTLLGDDGWIKVYDDDTNTLLETFTKETWNQYFSSNYYKYKIPVKHIRVETSATKPDEKISVCNIKELDDNKIYEKYTAEQFEKIKYITSYIAGYLEGSLINTDVHSARYQIPVSTAEIGITPGVISTQKTEEHAKIKISSNGNYDLKKKWQNGIFMVEIPSTILDFKLNSVTTSVKNVNILSSEVCEIDGKQFVKIITSNDTPADVSLTIDADITPDPRKFSETETLKLYAYNEYCTNYSSSTEDKYDINGNMNTQEEILYQTTGLSLVSPNTLLTAETVKDYNDKDEITIAPKIANVLKEQRTATIQLSITNNYSGTISDINILGKTPFEGNTYVINGKELGSNFTANMSNTGIVVPDALKQYTTVYYSENENPSKDIADSSNGWSTSVSDFSKVRSYLIKIDNYSLPVNSSYNFTYQVKLPEGLEYNQVSYSHHAIYYKLDTSEGKYAQSTEPNKVGIMISKKYDLELTKYQKNKSKKVSYAIYSVHDEDFDETKTASTNSEGILTISDLYVDRTYTLKEIKAPDDYEINTEEIKFKVIEENSELKYQLLSGTPKTIRMDLSGEKGKIKIELEEQARAKLRIKKVEKDTDTGLKEVAYKVTGKGMGTGKFSYTKSDGTFEIKGFYIGEEYTLQELSAEGYYVASTPIKFIINENNGNFTAEIKQGEVKNTEIITEDELPVLNLKIEDKKVPQYQIQITKKASNKDVVLPNAFFELKGETKDEIVATDADGVITINGLYAYETNESGVTGEYTLQEIATPQGYVLNSQTIKFRVDKTADGFKLNVLEGAFDSSTIENDVLKVEIKNDPIFTIVKKDGETAELIPNVKFAIYNVTYDENSEEVLSEAFNAEGNSVGTKETINGTEYQVITTDENGEINLDLVSGIYKVIEVETLDKYELPENEDDRTYYIAVGDTDNVGFGNAKEINNNISRTNGGYTTWIPQITKVDDGYVIIKRYDKNDVISGKDTANKKEIVITKFDNYLVKYNKNDKIESICGLNCNTRSSDFLYGMGYVNQKIVVYQKSEIDFSADKTLSNEEIKFTNKVVYRITFDLNLKVEKVEDSGLYCISNYSENSSAVDFRNACASAICATNDGGYMTAFILGSISSSYKYFIEASATKLNKQIDLDIPSCDAYIGLILKYDSNGKVDNYQILTSDGTNTKTGIKVEIANLKNTPDGGYVLIGSERYDAIYFSENQTVNGESLKMPMPGENGSSYPFIIKLDKDLKVEWINCLEEKNSPDYGAVFNDVLVEDNGDMIAVGMIGQTTKTILSTSTVNGIEIEIPQSRDTYRGVVVKYRNDGKIYWAKSPEVIYEYTYNGEEKTDEFALGTVYSTIEKKSDGKYVISSAYPSRNRNDIMKVNQEYTKNGKLIKFLGKNTYSVLIQIDEEGMISSVNTMNNVALPSTGDGKMNTSFIFSGSVYSAGLEGKIYKYQLDISQTVEKAELEVENNKKEYKITTDIEEFNGIKGGSISGEDEVAYEVVKHGNSSTKEIKMIPDENYEIIKITINGEQQLFTKNADGSYTLPQINDIQEDKHIVVTYSLKTQKLTINKTDSTGNKKVEGAKFKLEQIEDRTVPENVVGELTNNGTYYFVEDNGSYKSNNKGITGSTADSYVTLDLREKSGYYKVVVNAELNSNRSYGDYAYSKITETRYKPSYSSSDSLIYLSQKTEAKDYSVDVKGGKLYYLHFRYNKSSYGSGSSGDIDAFIINSIKIELSDAGLYHAEVETDANGKAEVQLPFGKYKLTETKAPEGYVLDSTVREIEFRENGTHEITLQNTEIPKLIVHHYIKSTTTQLAEDEKSEGTIGEQYTTSPHLDFEKYELEKDSNGEYILPTNASGTYKEGTTEVTYYYVEKKIPLTVHHYIEGTTDKVPLKAGGTASDVTGSGKEGESYTTSAIANDKLSDEYELVEPPSNANGTYSGNEVIVTYYYKKVERKVNLVKYKEDGKTPLAGAKFKINGVEYTTDENGKISTTLNAGTYDVTEIEAPTDYKLPSNPTTKLIVTRDTDEALINITNEKKTGTVTVHHYIQGTTTKVPLADGSTANDEVKTGNVGDMYATKSVDNLSERYELVSEPSNGSGTYIDGNIEVIYYYKTIPTSVIVHHYLEGTTTKLADDVIHDGIVGDNYTTGVATVDSKYEVVAIPANANGKMTREQIVVIYYYRVKDTSVLVHHYKEGTSESLSKDVTIPGKVDDDYTTSVASDIPSKYELVATPTNASGKMTVAQTVVTYYYRLKTTGVDVHYYKEGTTEKVSKDVAIEGRVDQAYTTAPATDVESKYELVETPANATGTMTESRITVIYYYRLKDTSVLVHHYLENTTTKLADDVTINGKVDSSYKTVANTDLLAGKYELVAEPTNKSGIMTEAQIVVIYYYRVKDTSVLVHHYKEGTTEKISEDVTIDGKIDEEYTTTIADDLPEYYELVAEPTNKSGTMTEEQIVVIYYYRLKKYPYTVNYLEKDTGNVLHDAKQGGALTYGSTVNSSDEKINIDGYKFDSYDKETLTIGTTNNVINIYYTKRTDLSYKVNYLEKDTNKVLHDQKVQGGMTFESVVTSADEVIDIDGYNYDSVDKATLKITTGENVINIYYTKRNDLSYTVNYLEKDTNKVLHNPKNQTGMTFGDIITSSTEVIDIDGYDYNSVDKNSISIGTSENIINIYYTKRTDLSYKVNYLEKTTNKVLHNQKVQGGMTFESVVDSSKEVINIDGYNYDSVDKATLTITTGENIINIYYTKRNDLSYTVNYLEKTTNKVLHNPKTVENKTFGDIIQSADEKIDIDGYNYDSVDKDTLTITTGENVINIYYTKRNDLSYKVNYLEKGTNKVLHNPKTVENKTFGDIIQSADEKIDIDGYNYDSVDKDTLTITTGENVINIYYTKRNDLSYKVNYLEKTTNKVLHDQKVQDGMTFEAEVKSADEVIDINGYKYDSSDKESIKITTGENVINIYYTKVDGLSYTVNYLEKDTNEVINPPKIQDGMTFEDVVTSANEVIDIDGYNYDSVDKDTLTITTGENVINIYYTKRNDLSYKVNYLEKGTNKVLHNQKVQENMIFKATVTSSDEVIDIDGYNYDSVDKETLTIGTSENVINIYYTKRTDLCYKVNYLEKDTNKVLHDQKTQDGMTFESTVKSSDEVIDIDGYNYDSVDKDTLTITTGENVINIYYTKRNDLSYKVNYLEKDTNKVLHDQKTQDGMTFEDVVTSSDEVINIDGYNYDSVDKDTLMITTDENIINIYYTKRNDLSYTVNYLEKDTNIVLHEPKVTENMTFETEITSSKEVIDIDGYNYDSVDKDTLIIGTGENVINVYYTKRNDLSYTVNYLEKGTNRTIHAPKVTQNMTFGTEITSSKEVIAINGYSYDSVDKDSLIITTGENVINIYYTKVSGLSYTVNYLEKDTNEVLQAPKTKGDMTFEDEIISSNEVIDIDGYNYDSVDKDKLVIGTGENVINIYYTKRTDLSYTVNYLEKDTNKVLHDQKTQDGMTFESVVTSADEVIDIDGYNYDSVDKETLTITTEENVINIYYTKRTDLSYTVNYLEKDTNKILHEPKTTENMTFESNVNSADEVISIYGYNYDSVDKDTLTITTGKNVINIYYTKKDTKVTVHYYEEGTTNKVSEDVEIPGKVFDDYTTESASDIPSKYELVAEPENKNGIMTEDEITVIYYYRKKATQVIVHYYEENTTKKLSEDVTINGRVDDKYTTVSAEDIPIKYELVAEPVNKSGYMTEATIEVIYYYRVKDAVVHVRYLEKGTDKVLADPDRLDGKVDDDYQTSAKEIDSYKLIEHTGNEKGKFEVEPLTITYYYLYKTKATVQYIDKITGQILEQSTTEGLEGDNFITESKDFENYVLVEEPPEKTVKMTKEEQILKYYYIHVSGGVIEKHIDVISGQILANAVHNGNEGDAYDIPSRTFDGYDLVENRLPSNAKGTMKVEPVEVIYYYIYRSKVTAEYIDKNTGEKLTEDVTQNGHEGDNYITERKTFDDYKLVEVPSNADGSMTKEDIKVTYYYVHTSGGVIVNHIDIKTGKQLLDETKEEGYEGDPYETHEENIPEYDLVKEKYPENATGKMTIEPTRVTYYYIKKTEVNVKYVDKETGEEIDEPTNIPGHEGDDYTTEPKDVPGYDLIEDPENKDGTMTADPIEVIYYYKRPAKVIVNYYDIDTKEKLADEIEIDGHQNDDYITEQKDIKYYEIAKVPENKEGKMIVTVTKDENDKEIVDDTTYVNYYYRKLIFNLKVDKTIASVIVNGQETPINGSLGKVEVHRKNISTANVKVVYKIKVTNDSELTGKANVVENIPSGMTMIADNNPGWTINETTASIETDEIKPGESREYQVVLGWQNGDSNVGTKENIASIITENEAGFDEKDKSDNESKADLIVAVGTGEVPYIAIAGSILLIMIAITSGIYVIKKKHQ